MSEESREEFLNSYAEGIYKVEGFDADSAIFLLSPYHAAEFIDDLEDILFEMESESFEDDEWTNDTFMIIGVLGAEEDGVMVQAQAFLLHSSETDAVHLLEVAPPKVARFEDLPILASTLEDFEELVSEV